MWVRQAQKRTALIASAVAWDQTYGCRGDVPAVCCWSLQPLLRWACCGCAAGEEEKRRLHSHHTRRTRVLRGRNPRWIHRRSHPSRLSAVADRRPISSRKSRPAGNATSQQQWWAGRLRRRICGRSAARCCERHRLQCEVTRGILRSSSCGGGVNSEGGEGPARTTTELTKVLVPPRVQSAVGLAADK